MLGPIVRYGQESKEGILRAYLERSSLRGVSRIFGVSRLTVAEGLVEARPGDVLELDEVFGHVHGRDNKE